MLSVAQGTPVDAPLDKYFSSCPGCVQGQEGEVCTGSSHLVRQDQMIPIGHSVAGERMRLKEVWP